MNVDQERIKSTELYDPKTESWRDVGNLPKSLSDSRATTINNTVLIFGTYLSYFYCLIHTPIALQVENGLMETGMFMIQIQF